MKVKEQTCCDKFVSYKKNMYGRRIMMKIIFLCISTKIIFTTARYSNETCIGKSIEYNNFDGADYVIGGMFPVHYFSSNSYKYNPPGLMWIQAMLFAIQEINIDTTILPDIKLGYRIFDTCNTVERALQETLLLTEGTFESNIDNSTCPCEKEEKKRMIALVGDAASLTTTKIASLLAASTTPQISYSATSTVLSNKYLYKSFMRTIPPDNFQAILIADFLKQFGWIYVNVIACDDEYGRIGVDELLPRLKEQGICLAVYEVYDVKNDYKQQMTHQTMMKIKDEKEATVVILWCQRPEALEVLKMAEELKVHHRTWIATETYGKSERLFEYSPEIVQGLFGIIPAQTTYAPFVERLRKISPNNSLNEIPWLHDYWVQYKGCYQSLGTDRKYICPEDDTDLSKLPTNKYVNVIDGVYTIAHALHNYIQIHGKVGTLKPAELFPFVKNVSFVGKGGINISFNENGNPNEGMYSITNLQFDPKTGQKRFSVVGSWNKKSRSIKWNSNPVKFANFSSTVPTSSCNATCKPGYKALKFGDKPCCWQCVDCGTNEIQPEENQDFCIKCTGNSLPNREHTKCMEPTMMFLDPSSKSGSVIIAIMVIGYIIIITSIIIFIRHKETPIVKASNRGLSTLQIASMLFQLSLPLLYLQKQNNIVLCGSRLFYYQVFYTISVSVTFTKADRLLRVFEASKSGILMKHSAMRGNCVQYVTVFLLTIVGLALTVIMFVVFKPNVIEQVTYEGEEIHMLSYCGGDYNTILFSIVGYIVLISMVCSVYAFKARKLPHDFNEARYTSFAMFTFILTWTMAVPIYFSQKDENNKSASWCLLSLISTIVIFIPMYLPKCYAILFEPHKNTEEQFRENLKRKRISEKYSETSSVQLSSNPIQIDDVVIKTNQK